MRRYVHETTTPLSPDRLYLAITDIYRWPEWDGELEATALQAPVRAGARFTLKPKGGPKVSMLVEEADPPHRFTDVALLPLPRMRTSHVFTAAIDGTVVRISIEVSGPLTFLWDRIIARKQAAGAEMQSRRFLAFAQAET